MIPSLIKNNQDLINFIVSIITVFIASLMRRGLRNTQHGCMSKKYFSILLNINAECHRLWIKPRYILQPVSISAHKTTPCAFDFLKSHAEQSPIKCVLLICDMSTSTFYCLSIRFQSVRASVASVFWLRLMSLFARTIKSLSIIEKL